MGVVFVGMGATLLPAVQENSLRRPDQSRFREGFFTTGPVLVSMGMVLLLGVYIPPPLESLLREAATFLEVKP
jgi:hydrogenase-4 component F